MKIVFLGMPGSGKGTQAKLLSQHLNIPHISTGELFRQEMVNQTPLGISIQEKMNKGQLIDNATTNELVKNHIADKEGYILDGYPRTVAQAQYLDTYAQPDVVLFLELEKEEAIQRLLKRGETSNRSDDNEATIQDRIIEYLVKTKPLLIHYKATGNLHSLQAKGAVEDIFTQLLKKIES